MIRLSHLYRSIETYLKDHGDKEISSIATGGGSASYYSLNLKPIEGSADEDTGPITVMDTPEVDNHIRPSIPENVQEPEPYAVDAMKVWEIWAKVESELLSDGCVLPLETKLAIAKGAIEFMSMVTDDAGCNALWANISQTLAGLK